MSGAASSVSLRPSSCAARRNASRNTGSQATGGPSDSVTSGLCSTREAAAHAALSRSSVSTKRRISAELVARASITTRQRPGTTFEAPGCRRWQRNSPVLRRPRPYRGILGLPYASLRRLAHLSTISAFERHRGPAQRTAIGPRNVRPAHYANRTPMNRNCR